MSYIHNIYIPYIEGFHDKERFNFYKNYYNASGFNVVPLRDDLDYHSSYQSLINNLISSEKEEVYVIIDNVILSKFAINLSIQLAKQYNCLIKPLNKIYNIDEEHQMKNIVKSLNSEEVFDYMYYDIDKKYEVWPLGGAWVLPSSCMQKNIAINENIKIPLAFDFELCYKSSIYNKIIFLQSDGYQFNKNFININNNVRFIYRNYLESIVNLFGIPEEVFKYKNMTLEKIDICKINDVIFNIDAYISTPRYM